MKKINICELANRVQALQSCQPEWKDIHQERIDELCAALPSGSGIDAGTKLQVESCTRQKLVFSFGYHHMNEGGYYDGWTDHTCVVEPDLIFGYRVRITGRNRNSVKDYLHDLFSELFYFEPDYAVKQQEVAGD